MEAPSEPKPGLCIVSFDGGGPGAISQIAILQEIMGRSFYDPSNDSEEPCPADSWDMMGGVGFGGLSALLLGCLRLSIEEAMEELAAIGTAVFTQRVDEIVTPDSNLAKLREAVEGVLRRHKYPIDIKLRDQRFRNGRCKVVVFAATTATMDHCHQFRAYSHRGRSIDPTFVEAACATLAIPELFTPVSIGSSLRKQRFVGTPIGSNNPTRQVLEEALSQFGDEQPISLILSLGSGRPNAFSFEMLNHYPERSGNLLTQLMLGCERVAKELSLQLSEFPAYLRLNVDKGAESLKLSDWDKLGDIEAHTDVYLLLPGINDSVNNASRALQQRIGLTSLGELNRIRPTINSGSCIQRQQNQIMLSPHGVKQMRDIMKDSIESITLIDAIGNRVGIPMEWCRTYPMLVDMIYVYFKHQKPPGSSFVERGDYRLVTGERRTTIRPKEWTYIAKVGSTVEMSIVVHTRNEHAMKCPRCQTEFTGKVEDGWASCIHCSGQFQAEEKRGVENSVVSPAVKNRRSPGGFSGYTQAETGEAEENAPITPAINTERDGPEHFRLISVIREYQLTHPIKFLENFFTVDSFYPSVALRSLLDQVLGSAFISNHTLEPSLTDNHVMHWLEQITHLPQCPPIDFSNSKRSLFTLFVDEKLRCCLFCGSSKTTISRALGCVRSHLGHKPFRCTGCQSCNPVNGYAQFGTSAMLKDHVGHQTKKIKCGACGVKLRPGGIHRHWNSMHEEIPFPSHDYPTYQGPTVAPTQSTISASSSSEAVKEPVVRIPEFEGD